MPRVPPPWITSTVTSSRVALHVPAAARDRRSRTRANTGPVTPPATRASISCAPAEPNDANHARRNGVTAAKSDASEAEAMRTVLRAFGVPDSAIVLEARSRNTRQNATDSAAILAERNIRRVLLVTSASHMARSVSHFRAAGLEVVPVATDFESIDYADLRQFMPTASALDLSARALKEWVGQIVW